MSAEAAAPATGEPGAAATQQPPSAPPSDAHTTPPAAEGKSPSPDSAETHTAPPTMEPKSPSPDSAETHTAPSTTEPKSATPDSAAQTDVEASSRSSEPSHKDAEPSEPMETSGAAKPDPEVPAEPVAKPPPGGGGEGEPQRPKSKVTLIMLALCLAVFLAALDMTIVTTALPTIARDFQASEADYTWIGSCYLLAAAAAGPSWGKVSDVFGRKPVLLIANVVFFVGSLICALSIDVQMLEAGRVIQGIGGGGLIILVNICISDLFSMRTRGMYFGFVGMTWAIASAVGPILGGVFTQLVTWRWCFYINLPLDGLAFAILFFFLDIETPRTPLGAGLKALDWLGSLTIVGGTVMFLLGLEFGGVSYPWSSATVVCLIVFGVVVLGLFVAVEARVARYPLVPLRLFRDRSNVACYASCFFHGFVFISGSYFLPLYFQAVLGASPLLSGVYLFPFVLSLSFISAAVGIFIKKTGLYLPPIWAGMAFMTLGFGLYINLPPDADWARIICFQIVAGLGVGPNFQAPLIALQTRVPPADIASATAAFGFTRNLSTAVSVVIGGVIFQNQMATRGPPLAQPPASVPPEVLQQLAGGDAGASTGLVSGLPDAQRDAVHAAYTGSLSTLWIFYTVCAACGLLCSLLIGRHQLSRDHTVTKTGLAAQEEGRQAEMADRARRRKSKQQGAGAAAAVDSDVEKTAGTETPPKEG